MKNFKKILATCLALVSVLTAASLCSCEKEDIITVGIGQFGEHESLDNCRLGFIEGLAQEGFVDGENIRIDYKNASFDTSNCSAIAKGYVTNGVDLICAIATPIAQIAFENAYEDDIPVVFTAVTDPVGAALTDGNVTGTSDELPVRAQLETIRAMLPEAKKIGILYTTSESNSLYSLNTYKELAPEFGFEIVDKGITVGSEVSIALSAIIDEVDCISNLTDNTVVGQLEVMLDIASGAGKPIFGSEIEQVKKGCVAAEGLEYFSLGVQTGKMAARILRGESASDIPYETVRENFLYVNEEALTELGIALPEELSQRAQLVSAE